MEDKIQVIKDHKEAVQLLPTLDISLSDLLKESIEDMEKILEDLENEYKLRYYDNLMS